MDAERVATILLWPLIGLIAWWARPERPVPARRWFLVHLALGPLMLVPLTWNFVTAPARAGAARSGGSPDGATSASRRVRQVDREQDVATGFNARRRRRGHRRR